MSRREVVKSAAGAAGVAGLPGLSSVARAAYAAGAERRLNVLWIATEDMGNQLSCYGERVVETPNVDALAAEGTRYTKAFCNAPICSPSRSSFCTGMHPATIGAQDHRTPRDRQQPLPRGVKLVSQWFADAGYHTSNMDNGKRDYNFIIDGVDYQSADFGDRADGQPFFAFWNFAEPHRYVWGQWDGLETHIDPNRTPVTFPPIYPDTPEMRDSTAKYFDFIESMDRRLGALVERLKAEGVYDDTVILFFGDNGRTIYRGKQWLYDEGLSVPLIARHPGTFEAGAVSDELVQLLDLGPTSLDLCGLPVPERMQGGVFAGLNRGTREYVFGTRENCDNLDNRMRSARDRRYKYIRNWRTDVGYEPVRYTYDKHPEFVAAKRLYEAGELNAVQSLFFADSKPAEELYDCDADPYETVNLAGQPAHAATLERMRGALDGWIATSGDRCVGPAAEGGDA